MNAEISKTKSLKVGKLEWGMQILEILAQRRFISSFYYFILFLIPNNLPKILI